MVTRSLIPCSFLTQKKINLMSTRLRLITFSCSLLFLFSLLYFGTSPYNPNVKSQNKFVKPNKEQRIAGRFEQEFEATKDPRTETVPREKLAAARVETQRILSSRVIDNVNWEERGPNNVGGRTRAILVDLNDNTNNTVFAGGVGGGLWKTTNFQSANPSWIHNNDFFDNIAISAIVQDPNAPNIMYFGTGEGWFNADAIRGMGIWKSTDGGTNWSQLSSTDNYLFYYVQDLLIDDAGNLYAATRSGGLQRSTNSGISWTQVVGSTVNVGSTDITADLELGADGAIYVSFGILYYTGEIFKSSTGEAGSWTDITPNGNFWRIELATAPSDPNRIYALCQGENEMAVTAMYKSINGGATWTSITVPDFCDGGAANIFTRDQAWYNLIAAVDPLDEEVLYVGGVDALRSDDGGDTWTQITSWTKGIDCTNLGPDQYVHADHHAIVFENGNDSGIIWGTDGGISHTTNGQANLPIFTSKNSNYNITQFYACALHPTAGENYFLAGAQDNGTQKFTTTGINSTLQVTGGDGAFCHIDQDNPDIQITGYIGNTYYISTDGGNIFRYRDFNDTGRFINPTDYDNAGKKLYGGSDTHKYFRWNDLIDAEAGPEWELVSVSNLGTVTAVSVSPNVANRVYFGNDDGSVVLVNNAHINTTRTGTILTSNNGTVSSIAIEEGNENHLLVTYSNYGVTSIYESIDGGVNWVNIENNLPDMPVRFAIFNPKDADQAFIATELGVWSTDDLDGINTEWKPTNTGLANVRTDMLQYRSSDDLIAVATHGRGFYTAINYGSSDPICFVTLNLTGTIATSTYQTSNTITASGTISSGSNVTMDAGNSVTLNTNFHAASGSTFLATIGGCTAAPIIGDTELPTSKAGIADNYFEHLINQGKKADVRVADMKLGLFPNPSTHSVTVDYQIEQPSEISVLLFAANGGLVQILQKQTSQLAGKYQVNYNASNLAEGSYYVVLSAGATKITQKLVVQR